MPTIAIISSLLLMTACGTYQQVGTDNDGIYSSTTPSVEQETYAEVNNTGSNYYENYFKEKSSELELYAEDEVFTDVDDYEGDYVENDSVQVQRESYAGWGQENSNVTINVYGNSGFYNAYYSPFYYGYANFYYGYYRDIIMVTTPLIMDTVTVTDMAVTTHLIMAVVITHLIMAVTTVDLTIETM